ncbi:IclR family transcriptional regulator [Pseudodonghicola flavimaris]|uniref:IclR family transcriptional regulator n=1 Tax=Pseudodonghicola flavimaris TaxID=3050036 RepID=A0ABT7F6G5_9RHOB|nr:IclR family transcriptional regulator [Pseudodonghicola flavimaris]MDK3020198.1 IclR family transcriptional regulator [Pseudodonghicola flavimaris]
MTVKQIDNLLLLLEFFAERQRPATLADVVSHFGWPRSSAFNILSTLTERGYLYEPQARSGYYPTPRWSQIAMAFAEGEPIPERLIRIMAELAAETGETVCISASSGLFAVFLDVIESPASIRYAAKPGKRVPIHATASGQALLSQYPDHDLEVLLRKITFERYGTGSPTSIEEVLSQIEAGRRRGWFQSASHYSPDLGGVAVPVVEGQRIFAVTIAGPLFRVADKAESHARSLHRAIERVFGEGHSQETLKNFDVPALT